MIDEKDRLWRMAWCGIDDERHTDTERDIAKAIRWEQEKAREKLRSKPLGIGVAAVG